MLRLANPFVAVHQVCRPSRQGRVDDPLVRKIQFIRAVVGLIAAAWVMTSYRLVADAGSLAHDRANQMATSAVVLPAAFPVVVGAFIAASRAHNRRMYFLRSLKPLGSLLAIAGGVLYFVLLADGVLTGGPIEDPPENPTTSDYVMLMYLVSLCVLALWVFFFVCYGVIISLVHIARTADIHEVLPPIIATVLVWVLAVMDLFSNDYEGAPMAVRFAIILGGPLSVTAVSLWELRRLKSRHGLTLRQALGR
ncbi:hypothetical protein SAMN05443665_1005101 [Actinomadura meyerae]|uniref:Uncharacterized protein n=1 Tax=Actinomadura meyerae TaxID=240840 RepID=A0A239F1E4_9ACTN|nr:hypothetical protein [Actinomadura meyerae]SNS50531.1 hypothetical protein SAMN05443665_1005101 [Actinomadura meyerae]